MDESYDEKFTRCIVCSNYTIQIQCHNIFNTTLGKGKLLLSDFIKNVLDCSVLIVMAPEFYICKRCFQLCTELDISLSRSCELKGTIKDLFKTAKEHENNQRELEKAAVKTEVFIEDTNEDSLHEDLLHEDPFSEDQLREDSQDYFDFEPATEETIEAIQTFMETDLVENEVTIDGSVEDSSYNSVEAQEVVETTHTNSKVTDVTEAETWMCKTCNKSFSSSQLLKVHKKDSPDCRRKPEDLQIQSTFEFKDYSVKLRKRKKVYFCNQCTYETSVAANMEAHVSTHKADPPFMCDICGRRFKYMKTFKRHQAVHDTSRPFPCKLCTFRAVDEVQLKIHVRGHNDQKKFFCSHCEYKTIRKMSFVIHLRTHTGERPYCCPTCPFKTKDPSSLRRHRRLHGGLKRYHCTVCEYKSMQKGAISRHMLIHTGEKPFSCPECKYRSTNKQNLDGHIASKHRKETPFSCSHCDYKTKVKRVLLNHMTKHTGEKPFPCPQCSYRARLKASLRYHIRSRHPIGGFPLVRYVDASRIKVFEGENVQFSDDECPTESEEEA